MTTFAPQLVVGNALLHYQDWPKPTLIVSDGAYGTSAWPGDLDSVDGIIDWYEPHIEAWTNCATDETSLWLWCSEIGWANLHPILSEYDWTFQGCNIWDKGNAHANMSEAPSSTFPAVTELCVHYVRDQSRAKYKSQPSITNIWREPTVRGSERVPKAKVGQKPLRLMNLIIQAASEPGDVIWEPFGGACSAGIAAFQSGRRSFCAESSADVHGLAMARIEAAIDMEGAVRRQMELFDESQTIE